MDIVSCLASPQADSYVGNETSAPPWLAIRARTFDKNIDYAYIYVRYLNRLVAGRAFLTLSALGGRFFYTRQTVSLACSATVYVMHVNKNPSPLILYKHCMQYTI